MPECQIAGVASSDRRSRRRYPLKRIPWLQNKLSATQVQQIREEHQRDPTLSWRQIADRYGVHYKTIYRIVQGRARRTAPGPIQTPPAQVPLPRCSVCGSIGLEPCGTCQARWRDVVVGLLIDAGLVSDDPLGGDRDDDGSMVRTDADPTPEAVRYSCWWLRERGGRKQHELN